MYISHVRIKGFRSLGGVEANLSKYTCLIGKNDSGKSSFLHALQMLFDASKIPCDDDFCKIEGYGSECFIEATLKDCAAHSELVTDDEIRVRRVLKGRQSHWQFWGQTPISDTLKRMSEGSLTKADFQNDEMLSAEIKASVNATLKTLAPSGRVPKETWQAAFKQLETEDLIAWENGWCPISSERLSSLVQVVILEADVRGRTK